MSAKKGTAVVASTAQVKKVTQPSTPVAASSVEPPSTTDEVVYSDGIVGACRSVANFEKLNRIGEGTYGIVYRARERQTNKIYALKKVRMEREKDGLPMTSLREIRLLKSVRHASIVQLYEVVVGKELDNIFLVFEYVEHDLAGLIDNMKEPFSESEVKCLMLQLLQAIAYLHDNWIIHRDLKLSNLLFNNRGQLKLADFGLARMYGYPLKNLTPKVVTLWYRPPELLMGAEKYTTAVDMWSIGCVFGELLVAYPMLRGQSDLDQLTQIYKLLGAPNEKIWPGFTTLPHATKVLLTPAFSQLRHKYKMLSQHGFDLLNRLLTYDPAKRISAHEALAHPYFSESPLPKSPDMMPTFPTRFDDEYRGKRKYVDDIVRHEDTADQFDQFGKFDGDLFGGGKQGGATGPTAAGVEAATSGSKLGALASNTPVALAKRMRK